jgi:drug/metabolite transporter (DMT)-like permease
MTAPTVPVTRSDREPFATTDWLLLGAIALIWGSSYLLIKIGLEGFHPGLITWARVGLGALALAMLPGARRPIEKVDQRRILQLGVVWVAIPFTLFPLAEEHINSAVTGLLNGSTPFFGGLIGALWFNRTPRGPQRWAIAIGFLGIALIAAASSAEGGTAFVGVLMVLAASLCYGFATNMTGALQQKYGSVPVMARVLAVGSLLTAPFGIYGLSHSGFALDSALAVTVLGVIGTGFAFVLMATLVGRVGGPRSTFINYLIPVVALLLGSVFLSETVSGLALVGVALILVGAALASRREH